MDAASVGARQAAQSLAGQRRPIHFSSHCMGRQFWEHSILAMPVLRMKKLTNEFSIMLWIASRRELQEIV
jgi:hypothetical protein